MAQNITLENTDFLVKSDLIKMIVLLGKGFLKLKCATLMCASPRPSVIFLCVRTLNQMWNAYVSLSKTKSDTLMCHPYIIWYIKTNKYCRLYIRVYSLRTVRHIEDTCKTHLFLNEPHKTVTQCDSHSFQVEPHWTVTAAVYPQLNFCID